MARLLVSVHHRFDLLTLPTITDYTRSFRVLSFIRSAKSHYSCYTSELIMAPSQAPRVVNPLEEPDEEIVNAGHSNGMLGALELAKSLAQAEAQAYVGPIPASFVPKAVFSVFGIHVAFPGPDGSWTIMTDEELQREPDQAMSAEEIGAAVAAFKETIRTTHHEYMELSLALTDAAFIVQSAADEELGAFDHRRKSRILAWKIVERTSWSLPQILMLIISSLRITLRLKIRDKAVMERFVPFLEASKTLVQEHISHMTIHVVKEQAFDEHRAQVQPLMKKAVDIIGDLSSDHWVSSIPCLLCARQAAQE